MSATLKAALQSGRRVYGTMVASSSPLWPTMVQSAGVDFVFIDTEHVPLDRETVSWMCRGYAALGIAPIVRIGSPCPVAACQMLDGGAAGIVAPYVESAEQTRALAGAVRFRPVKGARLDRMVARPSACDPSLREYLAARNGDLLCIVNVESTPAVANLAEILAVDGLDAVLIGPHDLSCSMGLPEQYGDPRFEQAVRQIIRQSRDAGVAVGIHMVYGDLETELQWAREGCNFILHSGDLFLVARSLRRDLAELRAGLGDDEREGGPSVSPL
ncbi:MAG: aldolase [Planctomycetota bacterium]|nr:MAG: aldolase [Planctomycetota bacterium]